MTLRRAARWACCVSTAALVLVGPAPAIGAVAPTQQLVALLAPHRVRDRPTGAAHLVARVDARRPITGERTVLPVLGEALDRRGGRWLHVRLPGRTLGRTTPPPTGWIIAARAQRSTTPWHVVIDLANRRVVAWKGGTPVRRFRVVVGAPATPTPRGEYFVEENVALPIGEVGGPFALATSARSSVLQEFEGGPGQIAIHGRENVGGKLGTAVSHGCIRMADTDVTWLAARIGQGVPVTIA